MVLRLSPLERCEIEGLCEISKGLYSRGWNLATSGNLSIRGKSGFFWQSPSGVAKNQLSPQAFLPVALSDLSLAPGYYGKPSDETPLHAAVYRRFPAAAAVVHAHPPQTVRLTNQLNDMVFSDQEMMKALGTSGHEDPINLLIWENSQDMESLAERFKNAPLSSPALILRGHGVYTWGKDCLQALARLEAVEFLCQTVAS